ncbi:MAG TPA: GNAT family N-acetyltransferase [Kofleriaceae bacterium]|jgi:GNAT superfamily N-acetyltransferase|nr:GNAT family N-acetyltransferase [Kofleriaceae bacterium]
MTTHAIEIRHALDDDLVDPLAEILIDAVDGGASVSFLPPLDREAASRFWRELVIPPRGAIVLARSGERVDGVVVLAPSWAPNQAHKADVAKLLVHRRARGIGLGRRLMTALTDHARTLGFRLLVLDTMRGDVAEALYRKLGWIEAGAIPDYAIYGDGFVETVVFYKHLG